MTQIGRMVTDFFWFFSVNLCVLCGKIFFNRSEAQRNRRGKIYLSATISLIRVIGVPLGLNVEDIDWADFH